jgi:hypothetical protein
MRELTVDERSLVAGGLLTEVPVWGDRYYYYEDPSWFVADLGGDFGGDGGEDSGDEETIEVKKENDHKIDPCKLGVPVNHLVPPKTWVKDGKIGLSDIKDAWEKALPKMNNDDLLAIKGALKEIRDSLPIASWWDLFSPGVADGVQKGATMVQYNDLSNMMKAIDHAIALPPEQRDMQGLNIANGFFRWSESKFFSFLAVKNLFKASCTSA